MTTTVTTQLSRISARRGDTMEILTDGELYGRATAVKGVDWTWERIGLNWYSPAITSETVRGTQPAIAAIIDASRFVKPEQRFAYHKHVWTVSDTFAESQRLSDITCRRCEQPLSRWGSSKADQILTDTIARAKREVMFDITNKTVPATVASFSELHDYVDANYYGGAFEVSEAMHSVCNSDDADDTFGSGCDRCCGFWNDVQNAVDAWLKRGRMD
jgi:hypothetical protein